MRLSYKWPWISLYVRRGFVTLVDRSETLYARRPAVALLRNRQAKHD